MIDGSGAAVLFGAIALMLGVPMVWWFIVRPPWVRLRTGKWPSFNLGDPL